MPNVIINAYLNEAFTRTIAAESEWPFYATTWTVTQTIGQSTLTKPTDLDSITSLADTGNSNYRLTGVDFDTAEDEYFKVLAPTGFATEYSLWGSLIYLWPQVTFTALRTYTIRGYRQPTDWVTAVAAPDCDTRLHGCLAHYAVALAYAQQEDEVLEATYMQRWQTDAEAARRAIMEPQHHEPLMMGPRRITPIGRSRYRPYFTIQTP
jgi:hypothetical protein